MKIHIPAILIFLLITVAASSQPVVVDASGLSKIHGFNYIPDVLGKVLINQDLYSKMQGIISDDTVSVYPSWPVSENGQNERGGVYANLDDDPEFELVYSVGAATYAYNIDGTEVAGWPRTLDYPTDGAPAFGDIDGDGAGEIVVTTHQTGTYDIGTVYAFEVDGTDVAGFPVATEGGAIRTPVLADLDGNGALEIIIAVRLYPKGFIYVYYGDGTIFPNWPQRMDFVPGSAVAVGDINGDEIPEIIAESAYYLHAFTPQGTLLEGFPYRLAEGRMFSYSTPVLADLDEDGNREIIFGDHSPLDGSGAVYVMRYDGTLWPGWPKITGNWVYAPPSVGDINKDGLLDIVVGDQIAAETPSDEVYAWTAITGEALPGFPITNVFGINSQIILADLDGDHEIELMFDDNTDVGKYSGYNNDGNMMENWPLRVNGSTFFINPMVVDINLDGMMAISGGGHIQSNGITNLYLWNAHVAYNSELAILPILQYNTRHNGVYGDYLMVGTPEIPGKIKNGWKIFPNPATTIFTLIPNDSGGNPNLSGEIQISIYASSGIKMCDQKYRNDGGEIHFDLTGYPSGIYWISVKSNGMKEEMKKFIIISN